MRKNVEGMADSEYVQPPFLYEIRVKGRLAGERWADWFDDLTISTEHGESTLRGRAADHAALYGLLGRLRDLAVPLVAVKVLDAEAQRMLARQGKRLDMAMSAALVVLYVLLLGGLTTLTVFAAPVINTALALTLLFALLAGLAHGFWLWSGQIPWRWATYLLWPASAITFLVYIPISGLVPVPIGIAIMLFLAAVGVVYWLPVMRRRLDEIRGRLAGVPQADLRAGETTTADPTDRA